MEGKTQDARTNEKELVMNTSRWHRNTSLLALGISVDYMLRAASGGGSEERVVADEGSHQWEAMAGFGTAEGQQSSAGGGFRKTRERSASRAA